jgi:hypothetical protein
MWKEERILKNGEYKVPHGIIFNKQAAIQPAPLERQSGHFPYFFL